MTSTANIFDGITKMVVQSLVSDEIPNFDSTSSVVVRSGLFQCFNKLVRLLPRTKFWRWSARKRVMISSFSASGSRSSSLRSLKSCSIVSSVIGNGGGPKDRFAFDWVIISASKNSCKSGVFERDIFREILVSKRFHHGLPFVSFLFK